MLHRIRFDIKMQSQMPTSSCDVAKRKQLGSLLLTLWEIEGKEGQKVKLVKLTSTLNFVKYIDFSILYAQLVVSSCIRFVHTGRAEVCIHCQDRFYSSMTMYRTYIVSCLLPYLYIVLI